MAKTTAVLPLRILAKEIDNMVERRGFWSNERDDVRPPEIKRLATILKERTEVVLGALTK